MDNRSIVSALTKGPKHHFFGFHDICPWDEAGRFVLVHEVDFIDRPPRADDTARICLIDLSDGQMSNVKCKMLSETTAWNFHQGARLQWVPAHKNKIIYNICKDGGKFASVIQDIETGEKKELGYPIYAVSPDGKFALGVDFVRLGRYGGYGYVGTTDNKQLTADRKQLTADRDANEESNVNEPYPKDDGIFRVDLETGKVELALSTHDVACFGYSPKNEVHMLTHITFNQSGTRICFVDKYRLPDGGFMQRLITANPDGTDLYAFPGHVTHYCWKNDEEIFAFGKYSPGITALRKKGFFNNPLLKPFLNIARKMRGALKQKIAGQSYLLFQDKTQNVKRIAVGVMTEDGHPQFSPSGRHVITDTYADKNHERALVLYDWEKQKQIVLGEFRSLPGGKLDKVQRPDGGEEWWDISQMRADLHPRWNRDGTRVCIDSVHEGTRQMYVIDVSHLLTSDR